MPRTFAADDFDAIRPRQQELRQERDDLLFRCTCDEEIGLHGERVRLWSERCPVHNKLHPDHRANAADVTLARREWWCDCREKPSPNCLVHGLSVKAVLEAHGLSIERAEVKGAADADCA